jgi:hypothetical protein
MADKGGKPAPAPAPSPLSFTRNETILIGLLLFFLLVSYVITSVPALSGPLVAFAMSAYALAVTLSTIVSMAAIIIIVYALIQILEMRAEESKELGLAMTWEREKAQKNERWSRVEHYMTSLNPSDWKVAILEADNILDEVTERMGYQGQTLGERMKRISPSDFPYLEEAWEAHKMRNAIAHKGTDYVLTRSDAEHAINIYYRIFAALGYL